MERKTTFFISAFLFVVSNIVSAQDSARVVRVKDADTYVLDNGSRTFNARLSKVDAPEMKQPFGFIAYQNVNRLIIGKTIVYDSTGKDFYGRTIVSVKLDGMRLDSLLVRNGWAWHYINYDKETLLDELMSQAAAEHLGLWACGASNVCPPWLWRAYNEKNKSRYSKKCRN